MNIVSLAGHHSRPTKVGPGADSAALVGGSRIDDHESKGLATAHRFHVSRFIALGGPLIRWCRLGDTALAAFDGLGCRSSGSNRVSDLHHGGHLGGCCQPRNVRGNDALPGIGLGAESATGN